MIIKYTVATQTPAKKSMHRCGVTRTGKPYSYMSTVYKAWEKDVANQLAIQRIEREYPCVDYECWCKIIIYRRYKRIADLSNCVQSVEDALQRAGCLKDDKLIRSPDGNRLYHGDDNPRFEVTIVLYMEDR